MKDTENEMKQVAPHTALFQKQPGISNMVLLMTILNILLATSPYSMPYAIRESGLLLGLSFFVLSTLLAYNSAQMIVESISYASAKNFSVNDHSEIQDDPKDVIIRESPFFIKHKLELYTLCKTFTGTYTTAFSMVVLAIFLWGGMLVKCVSSCVSLTRALSFTLYGDLNIINDMWGFDVYYAAVFLFAVLATFFALGNIENSKSLQVFVMIVRFALILLMIGLSLYTIFCDGSVPLNSIKLFDFTKIRYLIGNVLFASFLHHSVPGLIYPLRPQVHISSSLFEGFAAETLIVVAHILSAIFAFGDSTDDCSQYPCEIQQIFNVNYMAVPVLGQLIQFFPVLGLAVFPISAITLRNNLMQIFGCNSGPNAVILHFS